MLRAVTDLSGQHLGQVHIRGGGAAALAAARALAGHGIAVRLDPGVTRSRPQLLLNLPTIRLLDDLFGCEAALRARRMQSVAACVLGHGEPDLVEEPGLAVAGATLHRLLGAARQRDDAGAVPDDMAWTIEARGRSPDDASEVLTMGDRVAICVEARLRDRSDPSLCAVEAVANGWLSSSCRSAANAPSSRRSCHSGLATLRACSIPCSASRA